MGKCGMFLRTFKEEQNSASCGKKKKNQAEDKGQAVLPTFRSNFYWENMDNLLMEHIFYWQSEHWQNSY